MFLGATVDTKNALRTFLTSSSDFSTDTAARQRENAAAAAHSTSSLWVSDVTVTTSARGSFPPVVLASTVPLPPARDAAVREGQSASSADSFMGHLLPPTGRIETTASLQKSPRQSAPCLPAAAIFPAITDIARFSINSTGHPPLAVPFLVAGAPPVETVGIRGRPIFAMTSVPQPSAPGISSMVLPPGFVAGSALRLPIAPVQPAISVVTTTSPLLHGGTAAERSPISSQVVTTKTTNDFASTGHVEYSEHQDMSSALNWKLKMAREHVSNGPFLLNTFCVVFPFFIQGGFNRTAYMRWLASFDKCSCPRLELQ